MKEAIQSLFDRFRSTCQTWSQVPEPPRNPEEAWFAALAIEPDEFSNQLSKLQTSLQREGAPSPVSSPSVTR